MYHPLADGSCSGVRLQDGDLDYSTHVVRILVNEWHLAGQKGSAEPSIRVQL